jgi:hypothetical protein
MLLLNLEASLLKVIKRSQLLLKKLRQKSPQRKKPQPRKRLP